MMKSRIVAALAVAVTSGVYADVLHLKDGSTIEGDVKKADAGWVITLPDGQTTTVSNSNVRSIEAGSSLQPGEPAAGLASLRRSTESSVNPKSVVERYKRFIAQYSGTPVENEAKNDLALWQDRLDRGLVRIGHLWVSKEDREQIEQHSLQLADQARQKIKQGHWHDAEGLLAEALDANPNSATALYLRALIEYQSGQFVAARKDLETVKLICPDHGPTLNNLGVITARQNRYGESISYFDQAMRSAPFRTAVDNAAEALHALNDPSRGINVQKALAQRAATIFEEQNAKLTAQMKEHGLNRWGAKWVTDADLKKLQDAQKEIDDRVAALRADYENTQQQIATIDQRIAGDEASLRQMESDTYRWDIHGSLAVIPLPPAYADVQHEEQSLRTSRQQALAKLDGLKQQAKTLQRQLPVPKYTGTLQMVGADGAPIVLSEGATAAGAATTESTRPATGT